MSNTVNVSTTTNQVVITPQSTKTVSVNSGGDTSITVNQGGSNTVNISNNVVNTSLTPTTVDITTPPSNGITVTDLRKTITVNQGITSTVQVATIGPQGPKGDKGDTGEQGPTGPVQDTGSLLKNASYTNPLLTFTRGNNTNFSVEIETTTPTLAEVTAQGSSTTTAITASIISASSTILGGNLDINGPSNSHIEVGTYNIGYDSAPANGFYITGSGLIVSGAMADNNHHNFIKIGETEIVDIKNAVRSAFLIHNVDEFVVATGSDGDNLFGEGQKLIEHTGDDFRVFSAGTTIFNFTKPTNTLQFGVAGGTTALNGNSSINGTFSTIATNTTENYTSTRYIAVFNTNPNTSPQEVTSLPVDTFFSTITGAVTASAVSASNTVTGNTGSFNSIEGFISSDDDNRILTSNGNGTFTAESSLTIDNGALVGDFTSFNVRSQAGVNFQDSLVNFGPTVGDPEIIIDSANGHITASGNISGSGTGSFGYMNLPNLPTSDPGVAGALFTTQSTGTGGNLDGQFVLLVSQG